MMRWVSAGLMSSRSVMPRVAVMMDAVVQAMPFWTKTALYGPASPVSLSRSVCRIVSASTVPVTSSPPKE